MDRSAIPSEGCRRVVHVPAHADVHVRVCLLPGEEQPIRDLRSESKGHGDGHGADVRIPRTGHHE